MEGELGGGEEDLEEWEVNDSSADRSPLDEFGRPANCSDGDDGEALSNWAPFTPRAAPARAPPQQPPRPAVPAWAPLDAPLPPPRPEPLSPGRRKKKRPLFDDDDASAGSLEAELAERGRRIVERTRPTVRDAGSDSEEDEVAIKIKSRQWARRAKMRRVLDEKAAREKAEREANGEASQGGAALLDADEDSQLILSMLSRTQSSRSVSSQRSGELASLDRAPSLIRSASDSQAAWLPAAKKPRLGTGVSQQAEDTLLGRCGSFFAALDRSHSAGAPSAKSHAAKAAKTAVSLSSLFGLGASSQGFHSSKSGADKAPAKGPTSIAGIASGAS